MIFQKSQTPINKEGHTMKNYFSPFIKNENQKWRIICSFKKGLIGNKRKCNNLLYSLHETHAWTSLEISQKTTKNCTYGTVLGENKLY